MNWVQIKVNGDGPTRAALPQGLKPGVWWLCGTGELVP